jgi:ATP-dependent helicase/nuclease subunit B
MSQRERGSTGEPLGPINWKITMDERISTALAAGATVVTAARRLARTLTRQYNAEQEARGATAWHAPAILPWGGWVMALWEDYLYNADSPGALLGQWQERALWERVLAEAPESSELLQVSATAAAAQDAWNLALAWRLPANAIAAEGGEDAQAFLRWARRFEQICVDRDWIASGRAPGILADAAGTLKLPPRLLLAGFDEFTPQQEMLIDACRRNGCEIELAGSAGREFGASAERVPFPDSASELTAAARWTRALLENGEEEIAVVVPDLAVRRPEVERIFRAVLEPAAILPGARVSALLNFSAGKSLDGFSVIASAFRILALRPEHNDWKALSAFLLDRHLSGGESERTRRGLLETALRDEGAADVSMARVRHLCEKAECPALDSALQQWQQVHAAAPERQPLAAWARTFSRLLKAAGWPGEAALDSSEYQTVNAWADLLSDFAAGDAARGPVGIVEARSLLRRMASETMFQPETPDAPVQILGFFEAAGLRFRHLWVTGMHDEAWPAPARPSPFLPVRLQRAAGLPHSSAERELAMARRVTGRLLASADQLVFSYPVREGDRDLAVSPLILGVEKVEPASLAGRETVSYAEAILDSALVEQKVDDLGPAVEAASRQRGGTRVFQFQAACPFRAFVELRLGAEPLESPAPGLDPRERGTLVHIALEEVWKELKTHAALCSRLDVSQVIEAATHQAVARVEEARGAPLPPRYAGLERLRTRKLIAEWLELEKGRDPFEVVEPEGERYVEVGGIRCRVRIDRIDRLPDGRDIIIDYKTGESSPRKWETDRPDEPQLPLYSVTHPNRLAGVLFAQVKPGATAFKGLVEGVVIPGADNADLSQQVDLWRETLERLGDEFRAGHAEADPKNPVQSCRYCKLALLCRTGEAGIHTVEEL